MSYTPGDIYKAMGRKWFCDDDFRYSLDPNLRYSTMSVITMQQEWERRVVCLDSCVRQCRAHGLRIPKQRAINMQRDTHEQLELALFRAREEENRMRIRLNRKDMEDKSREYAEDGDYETARLYHAFATGPNHESDCFMSDDE